MTKYSVSVLKNEEWISIALFAADTNFNAMLSFCKVLLKNTDTEAIEKTRLFDLETGEVWEYDRACQL